MGRKDLAITSDFTLSEKDNGSFELVTGQEEFHQSIVLRLHDRLEEIGPGLFGSDTTKEKLRLAATRVARSHDMLDEIARLEIGQPKGKPGTVALEIEYESGEAFSDIINP